MENSMLSEEQSLRLSKKEIKIDSRCLFGGLSPIWTPISIFFSKAIANHIESCIKDAIQDDQPRFIRWRYMLQSHTIHDGQYGSLRSPGLSPLSQLCQSFDTVRWDLLFKALELFGMVILLLKLSKLCLIISNSVCSIPDSPQASFFLLGASARDVVLCPVHL